jgi:hypothetical protein
VTNGVNAITLHANDLAGNTTTTNFSYTLSYVGVTNPPALTLIWPQTGAQISGTNFTLQARVDDATATVTASIVDTNGDTNVVSGLVERSGLVWLQNLPLNSGTNVVTLTAVNGAGNTNSTSISVVQAPAVVTIDPISSDQLSQTNVTVTGTVSDPADNVVVNGVSANFPVDAYDWSASGVAVNATGTAYLNVEVVDGVGNPVGAQNISQPQPATVVLSSYSAVESVDFFDGYYDSPNDENETINWLENVGGTENSWGIVPSGESSPRSNAYNYSDSLPNDWATAWENAALSTTYLTDDGYDDVVYVQRSIQSQAMIVPQGQATQGTTQLYLVQVTAAELTDPSYFYYSNMVPPETLQLNGQAVYSMGITNDDGSMPGLALVSAPAGANVPLSVTRTQIFQYQDFTNGLQVTNVSLQIFDANTGTNLSAQTNTVIVGQQMNFTCQLSITNQFVTNFTLGNFQWTVPGNTFSDYVATAESSILYTNFPANNSNVVFYWADGASNRMVQCSATVNGKTVIGQATFNVVKPTAQIITTGGTVALDSYQSAIRLHCGDILGNVGMLFNVTNFSVPSQFAGNTNINWFQVATSQNRQEHTNSGTWYQKQGTNLCDGGVSFGTTFPYGFDESFLYPITTDTPQSDNLANYIGVNYSDSFDMYLMYQPNGGKWVPLQKVSWHWDGAGSWNGTNWVLTSYSNPGNPIGANTSTHPTWNGNTGDLQWQPE